ncbi:MAG: oxygen-independent coproporphyrinogen III oxidase [Clostridia bacterium]|nr:oxygen-independent coproporphyrinogen III oxidase [Clostridia bacterium]
MTGLYVHIPFCKSKCHYCDFNSFANCDEHIPPYFSALLKEAEAFAKRENEMVFDTLYFGGGTPSYVKADLLAKTIERFRLIFDLAKNTEVTVECNPGTIDFTGFKTLKDIGVSRLSMGLQSADDKMLKRLGRIHTFEEFKKCFFSARDAGFDNISLDLMYGLPDMTMNDWEYSLEKAMGFDPEHISTYALKIEEGTPFSNMSLNLPDDDLFADMYEKSVEILENSGYNRYEISNFAKPGCESRHNLKYWHCDDFLGIGAGAYSCLKGKRFSNYSALADYISSVSKSGFAISETTEISDFEKMSEFVFLGLRCTKGISLSEFEIRFGKSINEVFGPQIKKYYNLGFMVHKNNHLRLSDKGFFVSNIILADFV